MKGTSRTKTTHIKEIHNETKQNPTGVEKKKKGKYENVKRNSVREVRGKGMERKNVHGEKTMFEGYNCGLINH